MTQLNKNISQLSEPIVIPLNQKILTVLKLDPLNARKSDTDILLFYNKNIISNILLPLMSFNNIVSSPVNFPSTTSTDNSVTDSSGNSVNVSNKVTLDLDSIWKALGPTGIYNPGTNSHLIGYSNSTDSTKNIIPANEPNKQYDKELENRISSSVVKQIKDQMLNDRALSNPTISISITRD